MRPSTVQRSRFSFFSRETILAFAPCSTASTRAIESFQRNPNGGTSSSAARACCAKRKQAVRTPKKVRRIVIRFERAMYNEGRPVISVLVGCICYLPSVSLSLPEAGNSAHRLFRQLGDARIQQANRFVAITPNRLSFGVRRNFR